MKKIILLQSAQRVFKTSRWKKKIALVLGVSAVFIFVSGGLIVWGAWKGISYAANASQGINLKETFTSLKEISLEKALLNPGCLDSAGKFLSPRGWLEEPLGRKFRELRGVCLGPAEQNPCLGEKCDPRSRVNGPSHKAELI